MPAKSDLTTTQLTSYLSENFGSDINADHLRSACQHFGVTYPTAVKRIRDYNVGRGKWNLTVQEKLEQTYQAPAAPIRVTSQEDRDLIPEKDDTFVPFGNFTDVKKIINSGIFYPVFITGLSGNGKTMGVEQACAALNKEIIRVNITIETDEDDLIGGFRLVDGATV